jgi:hypothetical protein
VREDPGDALDLADQAGLLLELADRGSVQAPYSTSTADSRASSSRPASSTQSE